MKKTFSEKEGEKIATALFSGKTIADITGNSLKDLENLYAKAYGFFNQGHYEKALKNFLQVFILESKNSKYAVAIGVCYHRLKQYKKALQYYGIASILNPADTQCLIYSAECLIALGEIKSAIGALELLLNNCLPEAQNPKIIEHAQLMMKSLKKISNTR